MGRDYSAPSLIGPSWIAESRPRDVRYRLVQSFSSTDSPGFPEQASRAAAAQSSAAGTQPGRVKAAFPGDLDYTGPNKNLLTGAKGATFNVQMLGEGYADHPDGSKGVHNPFLYRALLQASVADMLAQYPGTVPAPPAPVLAAIQTAVRSGQLRLAPSTEQVVMHLDAARTATQVSSHR